MGSGILFAVDLRTALQYAEKERDRLSSVIEQAQTELREVEVEIEGLRYALRRHVGSDEPLDRAAVIRSLARTDAVHEVIMEAEGRPMSPNDVVEALHSYGRDDEYNAVSAAIAHLAKNGRVHSVGRGAWLPGPDPEDDPFTTAGENGEPLHSPFGKAAWEADEEPF